MNRIVRIQPQPMFRSAKEILDSGYSNGNGSYIITHDLNPTNSILLYCDMTNGGWTLVARGYGGDVTGWNTTASLNIDGRQANLQGGTFKLSDAAINAIPGSLYKIEQYGTYTNIRYAPNDFTYAHTTTLINPGSCIAADDSPRRSYSNEACTSDCTYCNHWTGYTDRPAGFCDGGRPNYNVGYIRTMTNGTGGGGTDGIWQLYINTNDNQTLLGTTTGCNFRMWKK